MKKMNIYFLTTLLAFAFSLSLQAASTNQVNSTTQTDRAAKTQEKYNIMERDENEDTDTLAIPFDDSEVEDEEEINELERKNVFDLPKNTK